MRVSIELFLLDNFLMDYLILKLAAVLNGKRMRSGLAIIFSAFGSVYALLSLTVCPILQHGAAKLLLGFCMAIPVARSRKKYVSALLYLYIAAFFSGGLMFALSITMGGSMRAGALMATVPIRAFLLSAALSAAAPRICRSILAVVQARSRTVKVMMSFPDRTLELTALVDSGNLLTEPISGLPVVVVQKGLLPTGGRPVPFRTIDGEGVLKALRPLSIQVCSEEWMEIDACAAEAPTRIDGADAIIDVALLTVGGFVNDVCEAENGDPWFVSTIPVDPGKAHILHPFRRDPAGPLSPGGGAGMDPEAVQGGSGCQECFDRA